MSTLPQVAINKLDHLGSVPIKITEGNFVGDDRGSVYSNARMSVRGSERGSTKIVPDLRSVLSASFSENDGKPADARSMRSLDKASVKTTQSVINLRKKAHLRSALISKLLDKYHPGISNSKTEQLINSEIDRLLAIGIVSEDDLRATEAKVRKQSNDDIASIATNPFKRIPRHKCGEADDWAQMNQKKLLDKKVSDEQKAEAQRRKKEEFRQQLAQQVKAVEDRKISLLDEKRRDAIQVKREVQDFVMEREKTRQEQIENFRKIREERQIEMDTVKRKKESAKEEKRMEERKMMAQLQENQQADIIKQRIKKDDDMQRARRWQADNEQHLRAKEQVRAAQKREDWEIQKKAMKIADEKEARRLRELDELKVKMKAREAQYAEYGASLAKQAKEDEERMLLVQREAKQKADKEHDAKLAQERQKKLVIRESLDKQIHDEEVRRLQEKQAVAEQSKIWRRQAMDAVVEANKQEEAKRHAVEEYRIQLEDQLRADVKKRPGRELKMSETERKINRDSL